MGDIKMNLQFLLDKVSDRTQNKFQLLNEVCGLTEHSNDSYMSAVNAIKIIRRELLEDSIVFGDDGSHTFYAIKHFNIRKPGTFFFDDVFGAMGHAIGYS